MRNEEMLYTIISVIQCMTFCMSILMHKMLLILCKSQPWPGLYHGSVEAAVVPE